MALAAIFKTMIEELEGDDPIFLPSAFWRDLNQRNLKMLEAEGLRNFKRTVSPNYFNWVISSISHPLFAHALREWLRRPNLLPLLTRLTETEHLRFTTSDEPVRLSRLHRQIYRLYVSFVWTIMTRHDHHRFRFKVAEPQTGNPFPVKYGRNLLSQDLANSIIECNLIADHLDCIVKPRVAELGAGYGRLAHVCANVLPGQYFIFDIPPALGIAQWYLEQTLGRQRVYRFRHFDRFEDVEREMSSASVVLLTPNQLRKIPDGYFDMVLTISTLPEMQEKQVRLYLEEFQRLSRGHIMIKQFKAWKNPADGTDLTAESYRLAPSWRITLDRSDPVIPTFFNRVWSRQ